MAPTLFIMVFQLAVMELSAEFKNNNVKILEAQISDSTTEALIRKHGVSDMMKMDPIALLILLYLDDGAIPFASRRDATVGTKLCTDVMSKFGLIIHTGTAEKESKTKAVFFPSTLTIKRWRKNSQFLSLKSNGTTNATQKESNDLIQLTEEKLVNLKEIYSNAPETAPLKINSMESIPFTSEFCYLGTMIDFLLDDISDVKARIAKATKAVGALNFVWKSNQISLETKKKNI